MFLCSKMSLVVIVSRFEILALFFFYTNTCRTAAPSWCLAGWEHPDPGKFASLRQHPAPSIAVLFLPSLPFLVPQGPRKRARVRSCVGMAVSLIEGVGPLGVNRELHEFVMSAMLAMAYWTGEEQRSLAIERPRKSDRDPGPTRLCSRCYGPRRTLYRTADSYCTVSSMRSRGRTAVIPSRSNRYMLPLLS